MELLVVMGVSLFGLAGLMSVYTISSRANSNVGASAEAIDVCEQAMEEFRSMSVADVEALAVYGPITSAGFGPVEHHEGDFSGRNNVIFDRKVSAIQLPGAAGLVRIKVDVSWTDDGGDPDYAPSPNQVHTVSLEMLRTRLEAL